MVRWVLRSVCLAMLLILGPTAGSAGRGPRVTGIYSDMRFIQNSGDVLGTEIMIVTSVKGYYAFIQVSEGEPAVPVVVPITVEGAMVSFNVPDSLGGGEFRGKVSDIGLTGGFGGDRQSWNLKRGKSYWQ
ncbi:MAG TPA: hypothetical protein VGS03_04545 [Candidatus Polarisedimenticolia bacterium]|nr:hypothetical protein [Candidatus Polarisedimenticolia bacterium]